MQLNCRQTTAAQLLPGSTQRTARNATALAYFFDATHAGDAREVPKQVYATNAVNAVNARKYATNATGAADASDTNILWLSLWLIGTVRAESETVISWACVQSPDPAE